MPFLLTLALQLEERRLTAVDDARDFALAPDGRVSWVETDGNRWLVVADPKERPVDSLEAPVFSPDGKTVAYTGRLDHRRFVVVNGAAVEAFDHVGPPLVGSIVAYEAVQRGRHYAVIDDVKGPAYDDVDALTLGPKSAAYVAVEAGRAFVVSGSKRAGPFDAVLTSPVFTPRGVAFVARVGRDAWLKIIPD